MTTEVWIELAKDAYVRDDLSMEGFESVLGRILAGDWAHVTMLQPGEYVIRPHRMREAV